MSSSFSTRPSDSEKGNSLGASHVFSDKIAGEDGVVVRPDELVQPAEEMGSTDLTLAGPTSDVVSTAVSGGSVTQEAEDASILATDKTVISRRTAFDDFSKGNKGPVTPQSLGAALVGKRLEHYDLVEFVGGGGMGAVFRAIDTRLGRTVAVKVLSRDQNDEETIRRFRNEAQSAARLDHPHIARVHYVGEDVGWNYIVFEFIEGINLRDYVYARGALSVADALAYTLQVAEALSHAASRDVVHRDIKPSNILLMNDGQLKVVDMGLARLHQVEAPTEDLTASGVTLGTFDYISPEQARDPRMADVRSDIYSLGCTLYFFLVSQPPFPEGTALQKLLKHNSDQPPDLRQFRDDLPPQVLQLIAKMLAKKPTQRFQSPAELIAEIHRIGVQLGIPTLTTSHSSIAGVQPIQPWWQRMLPSLVPFAALAILLTVVEMLMQRQNAPMVIALGPQLSQPGIRTQPEGGLPKNSAKDAANAGSAGATTSESPSEGTSADAAGTDSGTKTVVTMPPMVDGSKNTPAATAGAPKEAVAPAVAVAKGTDAETTPKGTDDKTGAGNSATKSPPDVIASATPRTTEAGTANAGSITSLPDAMVANRALNSGNTAPTTGVLASLSAPPFAGLLGAEQISTAKITVADEPSAASPTTPVAPAAVKISKLVVLPAELPVRSDWGTEVEVVRSLAKACARAQELGLSEIELSFSGVLRERPFTLASAKSLTIKAAAGMQPTILFHPEADMPDQQNMIRLMGSSSGRVTFSGVHLVMDLPERGAGEWSLLWAQQMQSLQLESCVLSIRESSAGLMNTGMKASFLMMAPKAFPDMMSTMMDEGTMMASPASVTLTGTIVRGEGSFLRLPEEMPVKISWRHGLFVSPQRLIDNEGAVKKPSDFDAIEFDLDHVTAIMPQGLYRVKLRPGAPYQVKLDIQSNHSILYTAPDSYLFDFVDMPLKDDAKLAFRGEENCYPRTNPRYLRLTTTKGETQVFDFENRKKWSVENRPRVGIAWKKPRTDDFFSDSRPHQLGKPDFVLDADAPNQAGFDPLKLPEIAPLAARPMNEQPTPTVGTP